MDKRISKYVGIPYTEKNCWDIVRDFYKEFFGLELSQFYEQGKTEKEDVESLIYSNKGSFHLVDKPSFGSIVIMSENGICCHVGVYVGEGYLLHSTKKRDCVLEPLKARRVGVTIEAFYECKN